MSGPLSNSPRVCPALMDTNKPGIGSILGSAETPSTTVAAASLRRTLSADMSSKKWLSLKKVASTLQFPASSITDSSSEEGEEDYEARGQIDIWSSIQRENNKKEVEKPGQFDIWSSIISQKAKAEDESAKSVPVPYIHPLVKRSASSLSGKSLEICTESLGSETGSDGFSSYSPSETGDMQEDDQKQERVACFDHGEEPRIVKHYNYGVGKKSIDHHRSFPPPVPSLSRKDGASLRIKTHRDNGRLVLEAVSMPSQNNFVAQRQNGRLVLTFSNSIEEDEVGELEEEYESSGEEEKESELKLCCEMEEAPKLSIGAMNVHRLAVMMNKPICLANRNPTWPKHFDDIVKIGQGKEYKVEPTTISPPLGQSLPPLPPRVSGRLITSPPPSTSAATSFNAYEYYWRRPNQPISKAAIVSKNYHQHLQVMVPLSKVCKEPRRPLIFWDTYCIATS